MGDGDLLSSHLAHHLFGFANFGDALLEILRIIDEFSGHRQALVVVRLLHHSVEALVRFCILSSLLWWWVLIWPFLLHVAAQLSPQHWILRLALRILNFV